jgi:hypothetical protein
MIEMEASGGRYTISGQPAVLRVARREDLPAALAQRENPVVIDNPEIEKHFAIAERWRTVRFLGLSVIVAFVICFGIALKYKIEWNWQYHWDIQRLDGKITLTPTSGDSSEGLNR